MARSSRARGWPAIWRRTGNIAFQAPASLPSGYAALVQHADMVGAKSIVISDATDPLYGHAEPLLCVSCLTKANCTGPTTSDRSDSNDTRPIKSGQVLEGLGDLEELRQKRQSEGENSDRP